MAEIEDRVARRDIKKKFYDGYKEHGLHVILMADTIAQEIGLDPSQARRCFDYLRAKELIRPITIGGGYSPTVELVDDVEKQEAKGAAS